MKTASAETDAEAKARGRPTQHHQHHHHHNHHNKNDHDGEHHHRRHSSDKSDALRKDHHHKASGPGAESNIGGHELRSVTTQEMEKERRHHQHHATTSSASRPSDLKDFKHHHHHRASAPGVEHVDGHHMSRQSVEERVREKERRHDHHHGSSSRASTSRSRSYSPPFGVKVWHRDHHHLIAPTNHSNTTDALNPGESKGRQGGMTALVGTTDPKHHHHNLRRASAPGVERFDGHHMSRRSSVEERVREKERRHDHHHGSGSRASTSRSRSYSPPFGMKVGHPDHHHVIAPTNHSNGTDAVNPGESKGRQEGMTTLAATTAPDMDEMLEAARQQGRQQEREETRGAPSLSSQGDFVVAASTNDGHGFTKKKRIFIIGFVILVILAAGVATWMVVASPFKSSDAENPEDAPLKPSEEDCRMVSKGLVPAGHDDTEAQSFDIEIGFVVPAGINTFRLETELELRMQENVLPALVGCPTGSPINLDDNIVDIVAAAMNAVTVSNPIQCNKEGSPSDELCSTASFQIDVFVKDGEEPSIEELTKLIEELYQDEGLLELLDLATPVENVYFTRIVASISTTLPSPSPTINDGEPTLFNDCLAIANGEAVENQETMATQEYDILLDVSLESAIQLQPITTELERKIQRVIIPSLAGCPEQQIRRLQRTSTGIANGLVQARHYSDEGCMEESNGSPCYRYGINLYLYVSQLVKSADFTEIILENFERAPLVQRLVVSAPPFVSIVVVGTLTKPAPSSIPPAQSPTFAPTTTPIVPSMPPSLTPTSTTSESPTFAPVTFPTTQAPTRAPSMSPSHVPTPMPSMSPSIGPTKIPTLPPTPPPTSAPTAAPSLLPTPVPTLQTPVPSSAPSTAPSSRPTPTPPPSSSPSISPTRPCFQDNTALKNAASNWSNPDVIAQYGPIGDWCFGPGVTSMYQLFQGQTTFNEDISNWDVSTVTDMYGMFWNANLFNQDISGWNVGSVTTMRSMFNNATDFNQAIGMWNVSSVTIMTDMFSYASSFNQNINNWDVSSVTAMNRMFRNAIIFNNDISSWNTSSVTTMWAMFSSAFVFNQDLSNWDVSSVTEMGYMFWNALAFNADIRGWDTSSVTNMYGMFKNAIAFNRGIIDWNVSSVTMMYQMFYNASSFNQNLCAWGQRVPNSANVDYMFSWAISCPTPFFLDLSASPPGPFCHVCS